MTILLTNDDGISSPGINLLAESLRKKKHRVFLVAPDTDRSGCSHSIEFLSDPVKLKKINDDEDTWSCSGTPADCVVVSLLGGVPQINVLTEDNKINLENAPDLILSGINRGANLGTDITYSGTAAAARQGSYLGLPSVALSLVKNENENKWHWEPLISYISENIEVFKNLWKPGSFVNINFPNIREKPASLVKTIPSIRCYNDRMDIYAVSEKKVYCFPKPGRIENALDGSNDWSEVLKGNAAYSLIQAQPAVFGELEE